MKTTKTNDELIDEAQSLRVIKEMIKVSRNNFKNDGILFIVWGWTLLYSSLSEFIKRDVLLLHRTQNLISVLGVILGVLAIIFSIYYIVKQRRKIQTYIGVSLRYVWFSLVVSLMLVNVILANVLHTVNFELQHPVFMVLFAFAITVTGGILRYRMIIAGGILFAVLALAASWLDLKYQLLLEAFAWLVAFIIPGHILYSKRKAVK
jgi:hypothetical protein